MTFTAEKKIESVLVECDVSKMQVDETGLQNYYWPISNPERTGFGIYLMEAYADIIKSYKEKSVDEELPYKFFGIQFLTQVVAVFQGDLLREQSKRDGVDVSFPDHWPYWPDLFKEQVPDEPMILKVLKQGPEKTQYQKSIFQWSRLKRIFKLLDVKSNGLHVGSLKIKPLSEKVLKDSIVATQRVPIIVKHAEIVEKEVVFSRSDRWFNSVSDEELEISISKNSKGLEILFIDMVRQGYQKHDIELKEHSLRYFQNLLDKGPALCRVHYDRLLQQPKQLPREIWTGTTGQYWDTMLRVAVMAEGGKATACDHGSGWSYLTHPLRGINELWGCDYFATFNDCHASEMQRMAPSWPHYEERIPEIIPVSGSSEDIQEFDKFKNEDHQTKTIFLMATLYDGDRGRIGPGNPNNFLVDWQARLIAQLKKYGYHVVVKMHPETKVLPPRAYSEILGAEISFEPFETVLERADAVLFDCIYTTSFTQCLATNIPIVLLDMFKFPWTEAGQDLVEKRCALTPIKYEDCRSYPDSEQLDQAIKSAVKKCNNHEFYTKYFV